MIFIKRLFGLFILIALLFTILTACGGEEARDNDLILTLTADAAQINDQGPPKAGEPAPTEIEAAATQAPQETQPEATPARLENIPEIEGIFEVRPDGFGFRNYGAGFPEGDFTIADLRTLFGDGVCSRIDGDECIPTAEAQQWISDRNADMLSGHCIGFTVASFRFFDGYLQPSTFSEEASAPFDILQERAIMRTIAANGSLYWVDSVWSSEVSGTPQEVVEALIALGEPADLSIFLPGLGGGHSLLAYDVVEVQPDIYHILVYDNNFPGEERFVEVDVAGNTWRYDQGAVNPEQEAIPYEGDASTETLRFIPLSAYENVNCPFCPAESEEGEAGEGFRLLSFFGRGQAMITTDSGSINLAPGQNSNQIPEARLIHQRGQLSADDIPDVALPKGSAFNLQFQDLKSISSLGDNFSLLIDGLPSSRDQNQLSVDLESQNFVYQPGGMQSPVFKFTVDQGNVSYDVTLLGVDLVAGQDLLMGSTPGGEGLAFFSQGVVLNDAVLLVSRLNGDNESIFSTALFDLAQDQRLALDINNWNGLGSINQFADSDGDGNFDQPLNRLSNAPIDQLLQQSDPSLVAPVLSSLGPYLNEEGLASVLNVLPGLDLSAGTLGQILQPLNLSEEQMLAVVTAANLPLAEMGELIFNLRLDQAAQDLLISDLTLGPEDFEILESSLAELADYHEIFLEWAFIDSDDAAELSAFLLDQNLTPDQMVELLPRMALNFSQTVSVLEDLQLSDSQARQFIEDSDFTAEELEQINALLGLEQQEDGQGEGVVTPAQSGTAVSSPTATATSQEVFTATPTAQSGATISPTAIVPAVDTATPQTEAPTPQSTSTPVPPPPSAPDPTVVPPAEPTSTPDSYPG